MFEDVWPAAGAQPRREELVATKSFTLRAGWGQNASIQPAQPSGGFRKLANFHWSICDGFVDYR